MENTIFVTRPLLPDYEEYCREIKAIWDVRWLTNNGPKHEELKEALVKYLGVQNIELVTNGHMALELTLDAMGLKGEVITTPFTFVSTAHAISRNGLKPVFCDVNPVDYTIDVKKIESLITEKTCAILPVHVYGNVCNIEEIERIAQAHNLKVVYDAAHAFGEKYKGRGIASYGDASCFSFHATKVFNTIEGGAVCYPDKMKAMGEKVTLLKDFGIRDAENIDYVGPNAKMNEFSAAMGLCNLRIVEGAIQSRKKIFEAYKKGLEGIPGIKTNEVQKDVESNYAYFPIFVDKKDFGSDRDRLCEILSEKNIKARKYFYPIVNDMECYKEYSPEKTPVALELSRQVITLPIYADLPLGDVERICSEIRKAAGKNF